MSTFTTLSDNLSVIQGLPTEPTSENGYGPEVVKAYFDQAGLAIQTYINGTLLSELENSTSGSSGAEKIGAPAFDTITSTNVADQIQDVYSLIVTTSGDVTGPASATDGNIVQFNGTTGKIVKDGLALATSFSAPGVDTSLPSTKAVVDFVSGLGGGDVTGPASATDDNLVTFDTTSGKLIQDSGYAVSDFMQDMVDDTSPQLGGELDTNGNAIVHTLYDNGNSGSTKTIDWGEGNHQKLTVSANCELSFTAPTKTCAVSLRIAYSGSYNITTWPATVKWPGSTAPTLTQTAGRVDIITFLYDGTNYFGGYNLNYTV